MPISLATKARRMSDQRLVAEARRRHGGTQKDFADRIVGVNVLTVRRWEQGESRLTPHKRRFLEEYVRSTPVPR